MKIAFVTTFYDESGGAEFLAKYIESASQKYAESKTFVIMPSSDAISFAKDHPINTLEVFHGIIKEVHTYDPDIVYLHLGHISIALLSSIFTAFGYKTILHIQDPWFSFKELKTRIEANLDKEFLELRNNSGLPEFFKSFRKLGALEDLLTGDLNKITLSNVARSFIVSSSDIREFLTDVYGLDDKRVHHLPLFLSDRFISSVSQVTKEDVFNIKNPNTLVYIGRIKDSWKNFSYLLRSLQASNWNLVVFTRDDEALANVERMVETLIEEKHRLSMLERIKIHSKLSDDEMETALKDYLYVVVPSIVEGFSLTILENLFKGKIVLNCSFMGGPIDMIEDGINGFRFALGDYSSLQGLLNKLTTTTTSELWQVSINAHETAARYTESLFQQDLKNIMMLSKK